MNAQSLKRTGPTDADRELASRVSKLGKWPVSPWQAKRWREAGLLPTEREFLGRGRGSEPAHYLDEATTHALCLAANLAQKLTLDEACLVCFFEGFSPRERALKRAYASMYERVNGWIARAAPDSNDPWEIAETVAARLSRRAAADSASRDAKSRLGDAGRSPSTLRDALVNLISGMLGATSLLHTDTLVAFGMDGLTGLQSRVAAFPDSQHLQLGRFSLSALETNVRKTSLADLEQARDDYLVLLEVVMHLGSILPRTHRLRLDQLNQITGNDLLHTLIGVPAALILRQSLGNESFEENLAALRAELPHLSSMQRLLDDLPPDLHPIFSLSPQEVVALNEPKLSQFRSALDRHFQAHPDDERLLANASENESENSNK